MHSSWHRELWIIATIVAVGLILGVLTGHPLGIVAAGLGIYLAVLLRNLHHLHQWLLNKKQDEVPDAGGVWGDVFNEIRKLEREANRRKEKLTGMLERFQSASAAIPDAMVVLSQHDEIQWTNGAAERLLGLRWPRDHRQRISNLVRNPDFAEYVRNGEFGEELQMPSPVVSEHKVAIQIIPFGSRERLMIARDISRITRLEEMRSHFVANVSHELRTPVTVLMGFIEIMQGMRALGPEDLQKHLGTMHEQAARMQRLVDDLLTLSKLETSPPHVQDEVVDVEVLLRGLKEQAEILSGAQRHRITLDVDPHLDLRGSREELASAFSNLINNAVRYTPAGGEIKLIWHAHEQGARFTVSDSGDGIASQHLPHLTERFYRVDSGRSRATGGTGLGLSIVKHILLRHESKLIIESRLGKGSDFSCEFPASRVVTNKGDNLGARAAR